MAGSIYIQPADYAQYGIASATAPAVQTASAMVNAYLKRPKGLQVESDFNGNPAWMTAAQGRDVTYGSNIPAGQNVVLNFANRVVTQDQINSVVILSKSDPLLCEAVVIGAATLGPPFQVTLVNVQNAHTGPVTMSFDLTLYEQRSLPAGRPLTRVQNSPLLLMLSAAGQYGYGRRAQQVAGQYAAASLIGVVTAFGGPAPWLPIAVNEIGVTYVNDEVWIPAGLYLAYYSDVRMWYVAGYPSYAAIPEEVKQATAQIVIANGNGTPVMTGQQRSLRAGPLQMDRFAATALSDDSKMMLRPFMARMFN